MNIRKNLSDMRERITRGALISVVVASPWMATDACAQTGSVSQPSGVPLRSNAVAAMQAFEPAASEEYLLGAGDEIAVDVTGHPELSGKRTVGPDGRITLPVAGSIVVGDKSREEAAALIGTAVAQYYAEASVTVGIEKYTSNRVLVVGAVEHPGLLQFDGRPTLLEAVTRGGALGGGVTGNGENQVKRPVIPERCIIYRGSSTAVSVDLKKLLDSGDTMADLRLRRGDVVYIPSVTDRYISVLGQVQHPGALQLENSSTLPKLLAEAGGVTDAAGDDPAIKIISAINGTTRVIHLKALLQPVPMDLSLKSGDIIFVPKSGFNRASYVLEKLSPLVSIFTAFAFLEQ